MPDVFQHLPMSVHQIHQQTHHIHYRFLSPHICCELTTRLEHALLSRQAALRCHVDTFHTQMASGSQSVLSQMTHISWSSVQRLEKEMWSDSWGHVGLTSSLHRRAAMGSGTVRDGFINLRACQNHCCALLLSPELSPVQGSIYWVRISVFRAAIRLTTLLGTLREGQSGLQADIM